MDDGVSAIHPENDRRLEVRRSLADLLFSNLALDEMHSSPRCQQILQILDHMRLIHGGGQSVAAERGGSDDAVRASLAKQFDVLFFLGADDDPNRGIQVPRRQKNQGARVVPASCDDEGIRLLQHGVSQRRLLSTIPLKCGHPAAGRGPGPILLVVDHEDLLRIGSLRQQFFDRRRSRIAEAADDDQSAESGLQRSHAVVLHVSPDDELIRRAQEQEPDRDARRHHHERVDESGPRRDGNDVAVAHRGQGNHAEVDNVAERNLAVAVVAQAVSIEPEDGDDHAEEEQDNA